MFRAGPGENLTPVDDTGGHTIYRDEDRGTYHAWCDDDAYEPASTAVVITVASVIETDPAALDPLSESVDPDALDALVERWRRTDADDVGGAITFPFAGQTVTVRSSGEVVIDPAERRLSPTGD